MSEEIIKKTIENKIESKVEGSTEKPKDSRIIKKQRQRSDLSNLLARSITDQNISVFIDAGNIYHTSVKSGIRVDFTQIERLFQENTKKSLDLRFYTAYDPENTKQIQFLDNLTQVGYSVIKKPIKEIGNMVKGNMDIELAVDAITTKDSFDSLILISGDGDFTYLVNSLEKSYKKTIILSVGGFTSFELHMVADSYFFFNRIAKVWQTPANVTPNTLIVSTDDFQDAYLNTGQKTYETTEKEKPHSIILKIDSD